MKRLLTASIILLSVLSCNREAPQPTEPFILSFRMPEECIPAARYNNRVVHLKGNISYEFVTDIAGQVVVESLVPGIYDIITNWEMSGAEYKAMLKDPSTLDDKARVIVGVSLMNRRIFKAEDLELELSSALVTDLMISKIYYAGTKDDMGRDYKTDGYVELFNNSDEVLYLDGKYLGLAEPSMNPSYYTALERPDSIYFCQICRFPGDGDDYPVQPGGSVLIAASSARNHTLSASTSVDLSGADFEVKGMEGEGNPDIPMLPLVSNAWSNMKKLNLINSGPNALVLFETDEDVTSWPEVYRPGRTAGDRYRRMHKKFALDGVECLNKPAQTAPDVNIKRLQSSIDAGYITITAVSGKNHESVERKVSRFENGRYYLQDTNNSSTDFVVCTDPTPRKYDKEGLQ